MICGPAHACVSVKTLRWQDDPIPHSPYIASITDRRAGKIRHHLYTILRPGSVDSGDLYVLCFGTDRVGVYATLVAAKAAAQADWTALLKGAIKP